ncbi:HAD family hydrolase [Lactobacillus sp. ESL0731]|uniref:HAD family hydrolase n=1 Tax=unclassified Lactobacillus TaxID=2620435 RepID=UPI0023F6B338|nr:MULTISPECIES: HAD family hydrolase [unclassified Lactobacillus]WEV50722.1 HAD family hydrolase [Lactobacillus sp. ESL0700]WEV61853.1 HAD family hydrolase [Lactobacillus sp. ESL0731]
MTKFETLIIIPEGNLLNQKVAERNALRQTLRELGRDFGPAERIRYTSLQEKVKFLGLNERIQLILQTFCNDNLQTSQQIFWQKMTEQKQLVQDAIAFLDEMSAKVNLVMLAKEPQKILAPRLAESELLNYFSAVYFPENSAVKLPNKNVFVPIFQEHNDFNPATSLVIGTNLTEEIQGAENANLQSLWLAPKKSKIPITPHPTLHLNKLSDLLFYLQLS